MKNPWKRLSKINPQREDGTRQINSDVLHALVKAKLPTAEMSVVLVVISKTWGFGKQSDSISTSQFSEATGFPKRTIKRVRKELQKKRIVFFRTSKRVTRGTPLNEYSFNKHYDTWIIRDTKKGVTSDTGVIHGKKRVSPATPTKEIYTKEKEIYSPNFLTFWEKYPRKEKKKPAFTAYQKIQNPKPSLKTVINSIEAHMKTDQWKDRQFIPLPATWLNARQWEDEFESEKPMPMTKEELLKKHRISA